MSDFYALKVSAVQQLTPNAVSISFDIPQNLKNTFSFDAGQYITLSHQINGSAVRRAYSIASAPESDTLSVGIKKVKEGTFSVYANDILSVGDTLQVMPPEGRFVFKPSGQPQNIAAFAAGSGITPIMSIAETVLSNHQDSTFVLVFGNQSPEETMYRGALTALANKYNERFFIQSVYSREAGENALFGRIEASTVNYILKNKFKDAAFDAFYLCGPEGMIYTVSDTLKTIGIDDQKIFIELFTASETEDTLAETLDGKTQVQVLVDDETFELTMKQKDIVLDAVLNADIDAPYSCQGGVCSSCIARVTEGKVKMVNNQILTDGELEEGLILTCQAHPLTPTLKIDYDDV